MNTISLKNRFIAVLLAKFLDDLDDSYEELCVNIDRLYNHKDAQIIMDPTGAIFLVDSKDNKHQDCVPILSYGELTFKDDIYYDVAVALANLESATHYL